MRVIPFIALWCGGFNTAMGLAILIDGNFALGWLMAVSGIMTTTVGIVGNRGGRNR